MNTPTPLTPAQLQWRGDTPEASQFSDIYFSRDNGLAESRHVFLDGNHLRERWQQLPAQSSFVIGETGFGTGLNFLLAWQLWQQTAPADAQLFFISTELFPLTRTDLERALAFWPELECFSAQLLRHYPSLTPGYHWLRFPAARVTLLLLLGDANDILAQLADSHHPAHHSNQPWSVNAWFLDGFAPAKNPQLWQEPLLKQIASLSRNDTTLATFTAAGQVRRDLAAQGFTVQKIPGYGSKREMSVAQFSAPISRSDSKPETPWLLQHARHQSPQQVAVIGAGLAGCHVARALAERGIRVAVYEQHAAPAQEASGNPQGALYTKLSANQAALSRFSLAAYQYAIRHYRQTDFDQAFNRCGLLQLQNEQDTLLQDFFAINPDLVQWLDSHQATEQSGISMTRGGWWLADSGWIDPASLCRSLLDHKNISVQYNSTVHALQKQDNAWAMLDTEDSTIAFSQHVVIACANASARFAQTAWLPLRPVRGQISIMPATKTSQNLRCVICDEGYLTPAANGQHCIGASFVPGDTDTALRAGEQLHNLSLLADISHTLREEWDHAAIQGRAALRCTTPDHLPMAGPVPDRTAFLNDYAALQHNAKAVIDTAGRYEEGLWLLAGFGGRGLCYIPLAAELLASQLLHQPRPLARHIQQALAPGRFVIRELIRVNSQPRV